MNGEKHFGETFLFKLVCGNVSGSGRRVFFGLFLSVYGCVSVYFSASCYFFIIENCDFFVDICITRAHIHIHIYSGFGNVFTLDAFGLLCK